MWSFLFIILQHSNFEFLNLSLSTRKSIFHSPCSKVSWYNILYHYKQPKEQSIPNSIPINDKEIGALHCLVGYVVKKIKLKAISGKDYKLDLKLSCVKIMYHTIAEWNYEHKLISALNQGGLTAVKLPFQSIFLITEEKFRYVTQQNTQLAKINISELTDTLLEKKELISYFKSIVDTSGVDNLTWHA